MSYQHYWCKDWIVSSRRPCFVPSCCNGRLWWPTKVYGLKTAFKSCVCPSLSMTKKDGRWCLVTPKLGWKRVFYHHHRQNPMVRMGRDYKNHRQTYEGACWIVPTRRSLVCNSKTVGRVTRWLFIAIGVSITTQTEPFLFCNDVLTIGLGLYNDSSY